MRSKPARYFWKDNHKTRISAMWATILRQNQKKAFKLLDHLLIKSIIPNKYLQARYMAWGGYRKYRARCDKLTKGKTGKSRVHKMEKSGYPLRKRSKAYPNGRSSQCY